MAVFYSSFIMKFILCFSLVAPTIGQDTLTRLRTFPYGIVFDYANTKFNVSVCDNAFKVVTDKILPIYMDDIAKTTQYMFNASGVLVPKPTRRLSTLKPCTMKTCSDNLVVLMSYGCSTCKVGRFLQDNNEHIDPRTKDLKGYEQLFRRDQVYNATKDLEWLLACRKIRCNYDQFPPKKDFQGWRETLVQTRATRVAKAFYDEVELWKDDTRKSFCYGLMRNFTHWIYPLECAK